MLIFTKSSKGKGASAVLLFGLGLVGKSIAEQLIRIGFKRSAHFVYDWHDTKKRVQQSKEILSSPYLTVDTVDIVWAAGKAGFGGTLADFEEEWKAFEDTIQLAKALARETNLTFHLLSSAGGLFENQTFINANYTPEPLRAYGSIKMRQERSIEDHSDILKPIIYRPSTVYGYAPGGRTGLVTALVTNTLHGRVTNIFGSPNTLRDFVYVDDIGVYIGKRIDNRDMGKNIEFLFSAKPTSMVEMIELIRSTLHMPVYLQYDPKPFNANNNSFAAHILPKDFQPTDLRLGVQQTVRKIIAHDLISSDNLIN